MLGFMYSKILAPVFFLVLLPILVGAQNTDPNCLDVPAEAPAEAWELMDPVPLGGPVQPKPQPVPINGNTLFAVGINFSNLIYLAPDLETSDTPEAFVKDFTNFYSKIPKGYELYRLISDPLSGLKYAIFKPTLRGPYKPWILSVAGTQTFLDAIVDGKMGRAQMDRLTNLFTKCLFQDAQGHPIYDIDLVFVGHSLGGGLLEAFYHQIQRKLRNLRAAGMQSPLRLITFNAFGGRELLEEINARYDESYVKAARVANYFVKGDLVSRIGTHIGPTYEMLPIDEKTGKPVVLDVVVAHALANIYKLVAASARFNKASPSLSVPHAQFTIKTFYNSQKDKYFLPIRPINF